MKDNHDEKQFCENGKNQTEANVLEKFRLLMKKQQKEFYPKFYRKGP